MTIPKAISFLPINTAPPDLGTEIGSGVHGQVYTLIHNPNHVVKLSVLADVFLSAVERQYHFVMQHPHSTLAQVFDHQPIHHDDELHITIYSATLERLYPLDEDEQRVMKSVVMDYNDSTNTLDARQHIEELQHWLDFDRQKVMDFYTALSTLPVIHRDFHRRNIMKDKLGNFKLIDFELIEIKPEKSDAH